MSSRYLLNKILIWPPRRTPLMFATCFVMVFSLLYCTMDTTSFESISIKGTKTFDFLTNSEKDRYISNRTRYTSKVNQMSVLARRVYMFEDIGTQQQRNFTILLYRMDPAEIGRLENGWTPKKLDPFANCSVNNCNFIKNESLISSADAVLFSLPFLKHPPFDVPRTSFDQRWIWMVQESPASTLYRASDRNLGHYSGYFNWSMTHRIDSDIPVPYGRTVPLPPDKINTFDYKQILYSKNGTVASMISNCDTANNRLQFVIELNKSIPVDMYGGCFGPDLSCPGLFYNDCPKINNYLFYLSFENNNCDDYMTEKVWWNALEKRAIPIVMGPPKDDYTFHLPPKSFIYVDDFKSTKDLAEYIKFLVANKQEFDKYHEWRLNFEVRNEHAFFKTEIRHYCRICEALNYNSPASKTYNNLGKTWNYTTDCYPAWNQPHPK